MSFTIVPPFPVVPRLSGADGADSRALSLRKLRDVVAGRDGSFPRSRGMALLQATDFPHTHRDLEAVLENEGELPGVRYLAAIHLGRMAIPAAVAILVRHSAVRDERVLAGVIRALGCIGDASALDAVRAAGERVRGVAARAEFAATLIAHRMGTEECDARASDPRGDPAGDLRCARPMRITEADNADAELCLRSLAAQPFGIELAEHPMYQVRCGRSSLMILLNRELGEVRALRARKGFLGVVASRNDTTGRYAVAYLLLTTPIRGEDAANVRIYRPGGTLALSGSGRFAGDRATFSIAAVPRPGAIAARIEGSLEAGRLVITTALSAAVVQGARRVPVELRGTREEPSPTAEPYS